MHYRTDGSNAVEPRPLAVGEKVKLAGDRRWWTVRAVTEHFAALTRQAEFHPGGTNCYTVLDWRNGVRGPCDLIGQGWGDGSYSESECAEMLALFDAADEPDPPARADGTWPARQVLHVSHRNWVPIEFADTVSV
jgi:hypothetical protein